MTPDPAGRDAFATALALLTGRALTTGELAERLRRRGHDPDAIAAACRRAAGYGYLDDRRTAAAWAETAAHVRGAGPRRVRAGLARRLLPRELVEEVAAAVFAEGEEARLARETLARWERTRGAAGDDDRRRAAFAHLRRRGFSASAARTALFNDPESV
ncbi:MAG TPA: RecX family transcriptional regulator [Candidatus Methanoperedens sp.]|nr:RecX family transcriptional regulator [Candidatus Methanoperedens sp.]